MAESLGILLLSGEYERVHYGFVLACGAASLGGPVVVFATNRALHGFRADWSGLASADQDRSVQASGVAGLEALRDAAIALDCRLVACDAGLRIAGLTASDLLPGIAVGGVTAFLADAGPRLVTL